MVDLAKFMGDLTVGLISNGSLNSQDASQKIVSTSDYSSGLRSEGKRFSLYENMDCWEKGKVAGIMHPSSHLLFDYLFGFHIASQMAPEVAVFY